MNVLKIAKGKVEIRKKGLVNGSLEEVAMILLNILFAIVNNY